MRTATKYSSSPSKGKKALVVIGIILGTIVTFFISFLLAFNFIIHPIVVGSGNNGELEKEVEELKSQLKIAEDKVESLTAENEKYKNKAAQNVIEPSPSPSTSASPGGTAGGTSSSPSASPKPSPSDSPKPSASASPKPSASASPTPSASASPKPSASASPDGEGITRVEIE